jgi:predicted nuclease of predicted toxin-antitoxin system
MRFLLDENVHRGLLSFLTSLGHDVVLSPKGLSNGEVFNFAISEKGVLVTHDRDFAVHSPLVDHPGIILLKILPKDINQTKAAFERLLANKPSPELFTNKLFVVFPDHDDELPFRAEYIPS